jgi:hypothetical protein
MAGTSKNSKKFQIFQMLPSCNQYMCLRNIFAGYLSTEVNSAVNGNAPTIFIPVKKNDQVYYEYNMGGVTSWFRFIYAQGGV